MALSCCVDASGSPQVVPKRAHFRGLIYTVVYINPKNLFDEKVLIYTTVYITDIRDMREM
jgi:hypothetical protein